MACSAPEGAATDAGDSGDGGRPIAAWRQASRAYCGPGWTLLGLVCPEGALRARWARPDLAGTGVFCCLVRSITVLGGGGWSLPPAAVLLIPVHSSSASSSCRPPDSFFGETALVASGSWWRKLVGGEPGGFEATSSWGSCAADRPGVWIGVFREKYLSARLTPTRCHLWVASPLPEGRHGYP